MSRNTKANRQSLNAARELFRMTIRKINERRAMGVVEDEIACAAWFADLHRSRTQIEITDTHFERARTHIIARIEGRG